MDAVGHLEKAAAEGASDLFLIAGARPSARIGGRLSKYGDKLLPADCMALAKGLYGAAGREIENFLDDKDDDFSFSLPGKARFRVNAFYQRGSPCLVARVIPFGIPDRAAMMVPDGVMELKNLRGGMVLVTGPAGSGKSTTQACLIDAINKERDAHIVTLEDPIEYLHRNQEGIVSQREIGLDTKSYLSGLTACLREAPDVILLGEMRDPETIQTAMTAAETGHLVIATLHTKGAANAVDRIIDSFPPAQQHQARLQASMVLDTVVAQALVAGHGGRRVPVFEILKFNTAVRNVVREGKTHQLEQIMADGQRDGMLTAERSARALLDAGLAPREALEPFLGAEENPERQQAADGRRKRWT